MERQNKLKNRFTKKHILLIVALLILILATTSIIVVTNKVVYTNPTIPRPIEFIGEYSQNGSEWQTLSEDTRINAQLSAVITISCWLNLRAKRRM